MNNDTLKILAKTTGIVSALYLFLVGIAGMSSAIKQMGSEFAETVLTTTSDPFIALLSEFSQQYYFKAPQQLPL